MMKRFTPTYEAPELDFVLVEIERGFRDSVELDDMFETEGNWD